jgi:hypothetical protein
MKLSTMTSGLVLAACLLAVSTAAAQDTPLPVRSFDRFEFDAVNARGLWAEVATGDAHKSSSGVSVDVVTVEPRLIYGGSLAEGGLLIPIDFVHTESPAFFGTFTNDESGVGDVRAYGKLLPLQTRWLDAGLGLEVSFPTGDDSKGLGTGEVGFLPFGTAAAHLGFADLRGHFGYQSYAGSNPLFVNFQQIERAPDSYVYGGGLFAPINRYLGLRAEFNGQAFDTADNNQHLLSFEPGFDLHVPLGRVDLLIRPTGAVGLTSDAPDWGIGGSVGIAWNPAAAP